MNTEVAPALSSLRRPGFARKTGARHPWRARSPGRWSTGPSSNSPARPCARDIHASCTSEQQALDKIVNGVKGLDMDQVRCEVAQQQPASGQRPG